ncbi:hypothetical protein B0920_03995 [Massilia sp. KIM]|uniref:DUF1631 family protein n=1 Tax=Massilia sp. KIM TaxID=1955422 RepID=UPI00098EE2B8|nr:DUF1631 family protein [Massilia sp. KIM]OON62615.1 hypothetical protein B0920_03995 [Massilia sp. KIM]
MATASVQTPAARQAAAARQATLDELVAIASRHAHAQLMEVAQALVAAMLDLSGGTDPRTAARRVKSGNLLKDNAYAWFHLACSAVELAVRKEVSQLLPQERPAAPVALSLVPLEEIDQRLAVGVLSRPFDIAHAEALATLGARLGVLLGRELVRAAANPFRPEVFLAALEQAWREFEPDNEAHALIRPLLRPGIMFDLAPLYEALNEVLKPVRERERYAKTDDRAARKAEQARRGAALSQQLRELFGAEATPSGEPFGELEVPLIPELPQGSGHWRPSGATGPARPAAAGVQAPASTVGTAAGAGAGAGGVVAPAPLLEVLARMLPAASAPAAAAPTGVQPHQVFFLPRLRADLPKGSLSRGDETTLELLSRIFETVLLDDAIPQETRDLIAFLQAPVLKAALRDRSFFFEEAHPARRMLDLLSQAGWEQPRGPDDPLYRAMRASVDKVAAQDPPEFAAAVAELEAGLAAREEAEQAAIAGPIAQATRAEKQAAAGRSARRAVALRLAGEEVVALVSGFLEQRWTPVLTLAYAIEDSKPGAVDNATRAMDDLIWSVKPKATQEQRKALIKALPKLLTTLNKWLDATGWQDAERLQFFAELAEHHASIVRAPIELSPERQLELAVEAAQQDALRRVAREQEELREEQRAEQERIEAGGAPQDPVEAALAALERGMRLEFKGAGGVRKVKLAWVSPLRTLYIFSGAGRQEAFSLPAERLAEAFRAGSIRVLAPEGVVGRVLGEAVGQGAVNDPAASGVSAA